MQHHDPPLRKSVRERRLQGSHRPCLTGAIMTTTLCHVGLFSCLCQNTQALFTLAHCPSMANSAKTCHADTWQRYPQIPQSRNSLQQSWRWCRPHCRSWRLPCICGLGTVPPLTMQGIITIPICPGLYTGLSVWIKVFFSACLIRTFCFF